MNTGRPKGNQKHLDLSARIIIEQHLNNGDSFRSIEIELNKDPSTISKEVRRHSIIRERSTDAAMSVNFINQENVRNYINRLMCAMDAARERSA